MQLLLIGRFSRNISKSAKGNDGDGMRILCEMHETRHFDSEWEFLELRRMLSEAIARGHVLQIPVLTPRKLMQGEERYQNQETGEIYSLLPPEEKIRGSWEKVNIAQLPDAKKSAQEISRNSAG